jgi:uncharacterized protein (DUF58 family)
VTVGTAAANAELIARISDLELVARIVVEGLVSGLHRSPFHGYSAEFSQYRHYRPGDDLKYVDWKLVARTDRVYTKQFRETTNMGARSLSIPVHRWRFQNAISKFRYSVMRLRRCTPDFFAGDGVGPDHRAFLPRPPQHLRRLLAALSSTAATGSWRPAETVRRASERLGRRGLLLVFSDLYDQENETFAELRRAARMGHEVVLFQVISRDEIEFGYRRDVEFVDLETGESLAVDAAAARRDYTDAVTAFLESWRRRAGAEGFQYSLMVTDVPADRALRNFLVARQTPQNR